MIKYLIHFRSLTLISLYLGAEKRGDRRTERERPRESERERGRSFILYHFMDHFFIIVVHLGNKMLRRRRDCKRILTNGEEICRNA